MTSQIAFELPHATVFAEETFVVSACNEEAHGWVVRWPNWPAQALIIYGEAGCGKTHLGHMWAARAGATAKPVSAETLEGNALLDNIERFEPGALFHLLNVAKERGFFLLLTAAHAPKKLGFTLPDLTSRLLALPAIHIHPPDDAALAASLRKQFSDRQLKVDEEVIAFLLPRIERSFSQAQALVKRLDSESLQNKKSITIPFVKSLLTL